MFSLNLWRLVLVTAFLQLAGSLFYFVIFKQAALIQSAYAITKIVMLVIPSLMLFIGLKLPPFSFKPQLKSSLVYGVSSGLLMSLLVLVAYLFVPSLSEMLTGPVALKVQQVGILDYYWIAAISISTIHAFLEEYFWRWYVVNGLRVRLSVFTSIMLGNTFFALHHIVILSQFVTWPLAVVFGACVGVAGGVWSWIYYRTGSFLGSWISHILADLVIFTVGYLLIT